MLEAFTQRFESSIGNFFTAAMKINAFVAWCLLYFSKYILRLHKRGRDLYPLLTYSSPSSVICLQLLYKLIPHYLLYIYISKRRLRVCKEDKHLRPSPRNSSPLSCMNFPLEIKKVFIEYNLLREF
jgi:hypothetical protein